MRRASVVLTILAALLGSLGAPPAVRGVEEPPPPKVAIIVGPVGSELTPTYLGLAEMAAVAAEERGATVERAYSPDATAERVLEAVEGANVVVYFGHGVGSPNPYSASPNPRSVNGWGLNGSKPSTLIDPSELNFVSFLAYVVSCAIVFGGPERPAALKRSLL